MAALYTRLDSCECLALRVLEQDPDGCECSGGVDSLGAAIAAAVSAWLAAHRCGQSAQEREAA